MFVLTQPHAFARRAFNPAWNRAVERLLDERGEAPQTTTRVPAMDVSETDGSYALSFDLPGIVKEQVKVTIDGRRVEVEATPEAPAAGPEGARVVYRERRLPRFARSVTLPAELDASASTAQFSNGVLILTLVKRSIVGPVTLTIA